MLKILTALLIGAFVLPTSVNAQEMVRIPGSMDNIVESGNCMLFGFMGVSPDAQVAIRDGRANQEMMTIGNCVSQDPSNPDTDGLLPYMGTQIATLIGTPPVSSTEYIADVMHNFGVPGAQQAYAQTGVGFNALQPVLQIWKAFRNIAYLVFVVLFMVIGFMIMFRAKLNPQTVVTVQSALPNLVITLILITFSYAIAGFLIDLIYVGIFLTAYALAYGGVFQDATIVIDRLLTNNLYMIMFEGQNFMTTAPARAVGEIVRNLFQGSLGDLLSWGTVPVAKLIIGVVLTIAVFKLFVVLGLGFVNIIISVIIAPLHIMLNAFPGSQAFSNWFRGILANVAMFPAVAALFMIGAALMGPTSYRDQWMGGYDWDNPWKVVEEGVGYTNIDTEGQWIPPFLLGRGSDIHGNFDGVGTVSPIMAIIGLMIIIMSPSVAQMTRDSIKGEGLSFSSAMGQAVGSAAGMAWAPVRMAREHSRAKRAARDQAQMIGTAVHNPEAFR